MTQDQVRDVVKRKKEADNRLFGEIAIKLVFIDDDVLAAYLEKK